MKTNHESEENLEKIIEQDKLADFILGQGDYGPSTSHPEEDYHRWDQLNDYYRSFENNSSEKKIIADIVLSLLNSGEFATIEAGVILSKLLELKAVETWIHDIFYHNLISNLPSYLQDQILLTASALQLDGVAAAILEKIIRENRIGQFLSWSSTPDYVIIVGADDLWRVGALANFYENGSKSVRNEIGRQISHLPKGKPKIPEIFSTYLRMPTSQGNAFSRLILNILKKSDFQK